MTAQGPLGITIGDAAGVGPELILMHGAELAAEGPVVAYGSPEVLAAARESLRMAGGFTAVRPIARPEEAVDLGPGVLGVIDVTDASDEWPALRLPSLRPYPWGQAVPAFGALQYRALCRAVDDAGTGSLCGILTAPWHKARLADAGLPATGHTEVLQERAGVDRVVMMLAGDVLRVALVTIHIPLSEVASAIDAASIVETLAVIDADLRARFGLDAPRIAVCALNPHAGEGGVMGAEDDAVIRPAVEAARARGIDATGPHPADTLFPRVVAGKERADAVLAMYHDQGLVPLKTVHFGASANITLGLPFVRTSVDHGTAYDIAGTGRVDAGSFLYAGRLARRMAAAAPQGLHR